MVTFTRSRLFYLSTLLLFILCAALLWAWHVANSQYNPFRVMALPSQVADNRLLQVSGHISDTPRPDETFNFPIPLGGTGPINSLYSGPAQYPFYCMTLESKIGQPMVDNQQGIGVTVYAHNAQGQISDDIIGYSKDCSLATRLDYFYINQQGKHKPYSATTPNNDIQILTINEQKVPFIIRVERGVINRFIYTIAMLVGDKSGHQLDNSKYWNNKLIFQFGGGSGIGFRQGKLNMRKILERRAEQLKAGYAVIASTGNITSHTYNMLLAEDTAVRVKRQFIGRYGQPQYTVGIGGSGGAIQQYLLAQNMPGFLDAIIPQYSYPDMLSQTIYALDCDLIEHYFAITDVDNDNWLDWQYRESILGLNHRNDFPQDHPNLAKFNQLLAGVMPQDQQGASECVNSWFGLSTLVNNPRMSYLRNYYDRALLDDVHWSYWQDMVHIYGKDAQGFAQTTWDNEGVQYGLEALAKNEITTQEFIRLNSQVGAWKPQHQMQPESFFFFFHRKLLVWTSMWSRHNITTSETTTANSNQTAQRKIASTDAIEQAYRYGQVFIGQLDIPVIDIRHYLEDELDMHHTSASFSSRVRMQQQGRGTHQLIWMSHEDYDYTNQAFSTIDQWLSNIRQNPQRSLIANKPSNAVDQCADAQGNTIAQGDDVWHGPWNQQYPGVCSETYPSYATSRIQAGDAWHGSTFKCQLQSVQSAIDQGLYGQIDMSQFQPQLEQIFSSGVCDYSAGDIGRPADLTPMLIVQE